MSLVRDRAEWNCSGTTSCARKKKNLLWKHSANSLDDNACYLLSSIAIYKYFFVFTRLSCSFARVFIHHFPLNWLSFEYRRRSRQRSHWMKKKKKNKIFAQSWIGFQEKKFHYIFFFLSFSSLFSSCCFWLLCIWDLKGRAWQRGNPKSSF